MAGCSTGTTSEAGKRRRTSTAPFARGLAEVWAKATRPHSGAVDDPKTPVSREPRG